MVDSKLLVVAMARTCREVIQKSEGRSLDLPKQLCPGHLLWMCNKIEKHADDWPELKLHRWIGFLQGGMLANRMLDFERAKAMFDAARLAQGVTGEEQDLIDHLDPESSFEMEVGGES